MDKKRMDVARNIYIKLRNLSPEEIVKLDKIMKENKFISPPRLASFDVSAGVNQYIH